MSPPHFQILRRGGEEVVVVGAVVAAVAVEAVEGKAVVAGQRGKRHAGDRHDSGLVRLTISCLDSPNSGGVSSGGSGSPRVFGGGSFYPGGASVPYKAGKPSSKGLAPAALLPIGAVAFFPGVWLYGAYAYPFHHPYYYHNHTSDKNESLPITCLCQQYSVCGCEDNNNSTYLDSLVNGTTPEGLPRNNTILKVANVNDTLGVYINGTLSNDTTAPSAGSSILPPHVGILNLGGYWVMAAVVAGTVWFV